MKDRRKNAEKMQKRCRRDAGWQAQRFCKRSDSASSASAAILQLLRDETAVTALEYVMAAVAIAVGALAASRAIGPALIDYLRRIYLVVTLPIL